MLPDVSGDLRGLYDPNEIMGGIEADFLVFCKLARLNDVVPRHGWDWGAFLASASSLLPYAFEKSDAKVGG